MMMRQRRTQLRSANYFTILFFLSGLFLTPSVLVAQTCTGTATVLVSQTGITNPNNALNAADAAYAELWDTGDQIVLNWSDQLSTGATVTLRWRGNTASTADPTITIETSSDGTSFTAVTGSPFTIARNAAFFDQNITLPNTASYIRLTTTNTYNVDLDAVSYSGAACSNNQFLAGTVFRDYNGDGSRTLSNPNEPAVSGVVVTAYNAAGTILASYTTTSSSSQNYSIPTSGTAYNGTLGSNTGFVASGTAVRLEFTNVPTYAFSSANGTANLSSVQFVTAPSTTASFGINAPSDYCQTNPRIVTSCYVEGDAPAGDDVLVSVAYTPTGTQDNTFPNLSHEGAHSDLGATYGLAYHRLSNTLFAASYQKRHTKYGSSGSTGAIYKLTTPSDNSTTGTSLFLDLNLLFGSNVAGNNPHPVGTNFNTDDASYPLVGKISLGDIGISDDGLYLWAVNLSDRQLYKIPLGSDPNNPVAPTSSSQITRYPLYNICDCDGDGSNDLISDGDVRPFGIELYRGKIYLGIVCNAESTPTDFTKLRAKVFTFDPTSGTSTQSLDFGLNYNRGIGYSGAVVFPNGIPAGSGYTTANPANWRPWRNTYTTAAAFEWSWYDASFREGGYPQPVLVDIEIADNGNMILGFRDRFGDMVGDGQNEPGGSTLLESDGTGDLLRATLNPDGVSWSFSTTEATNGTEFFDEDNYNTAHEETSMGGLALLTGADRFVNIIMDPVTNISAGFDWVQPSNGTLERSYQVFRRPSGQAGTSDLFAKSNGLGDAEFLCNAAPIEIGNRVFSDTDSDGIQDAGEAGINGVTVKLFEGTTEVGSTTTANGGQYYFTNANVTGGVKFNTAYEIRITAAQPPLSNLVLTTTDVASNGSDLIDNDGTTSGTNAIKAFTTGSAGENNHSYDFGFTAVTCAVSLTTNVSGCYDSNGNTAGGASVATIQVVVDWANNPSGETINVTCTGATAQSINPVTSPKPAILTFTVPANGAVVTVTATFSTTTTCTEAQMVTAPTGTCLLTPCVAGNTGGTVWRDYDNDGIKDATELSGVSGVTVTAYDCNGNLAATTTTDALGQYTFTTLTPSATNKYRLEFSNLPPQYNPTFNGTNGRTDVQFVSATSCTVNLGVNKPSDYCQTNPNLITTCFVNGTPAAGEHVLVNFPYSSENTTGPITNIGDADALGSVWGLAYARTSKQLYLSTFLKRHVGLLNDKLGIIYKKDVAAGTTPTTWLDVTTAPLSINIGQGLVPTNILRGLSSRALPSRDSIAFDLVGKVGFGDIDISDDEKTLYFVNLYDKKVYAIDIATQTLVSGFPIAVPDNCNLGTGTTRPFALKYANNTVYVGAVCDAQTSQKATDLKANVYRLDGTSFTNVLNVPLNYLKGDVDRGFSTSNGWYAWQDDFYSLITAGSFNGDDYKSYPQPILADLEFDIDGSMILVFNDRTGHQLGYHNYGTAVADNGFYAVEIGGDILRASTTGSGQYVLENNGTVGGVTTAGQNTNEGPGGGEFYFGETYASAHFETIMGGAALLTGKNEIAVNAMDPTSWLSGGVYWLNNTTGDKNKVFEVYGDIPTVNAGKSNGLGDLELLCNAQPLQVGNYVWYDQNKNGVQDPCEPPLSSINVSLWKAGVQIATTTTDANGNYTFTGIGAPNETWTATAGTDSILPNMAYEIRIDTTNQTRLDTIKLTTLNATVNNGNDQNDSDASVTGNYAVIAFTTGAAGSTNHTLDFGFFPCPYILTPSAAQTICAGATGSNITVTTNQNNANGIKFVKFTSDQIAGASPTATELTAIYAGTAQSTVTPTGASSPYTATYTWNSVDFPNATNANITYYVYAILNPDLGASCRPVQEITITVNPTPTTPSLTTPQNNICPATTVNLTTLAATLTPSVSGGVFEWRVSSSSSSALVSTPTAVSTGTYYLFEKSPSACYSTAQAVTVTIQNCCPTPICIPVTVTRNTGSN